MTQFDPPSDPYGNEKHCHICDACMVESSDGSYECLQYHEDDLVSQEYYYHEDCCPVCGSKRTGNYEANIDKIPVMVTVFVRCETCGASWNVIFQFEKYEMVGIK